MDIKLETTRYVLTESAQIREWGCLNDKQSRKVATSLFYDALVLNFDTKEPWLAQCKTTGQFFSREDLFTLEDAEYDELAKTGFYQFSWYDVELETSITTLAD